MISAISSHLLTTKFPHVNSSKISWERCSHALTVLEAWHEVCLWTTDYSVWEILSSLRQLEQATTPLASLFAKTALHHWNWSIWNSGQMQKQYMDWDYLEEKYRVCGLLLSLRPSKPPSPIIRPAPHHPLSPPSPICKSYATEQLLQ